MNPKWTLWLSVLLCLCLLIPFGAVAEESGIDVEEEVVSESVEAASEELTVDLEGEDDPEYIIEEAPEAPLPELDAVEHQHDFDDNGICWGCNTKKLFVKTTDDFTITKVYDGDVWKELTDSELSHFVISNSEADEDVHIIGGYALFGDGNTEEDSAVGSYTIVVEFYFEIDEWRYDYLCDTVSMNGVITPKNIADSDVILDETPYVSGAGTAPSVIIRYNRAQLVPEKDYTLNYFYDNTTGICTATIMGIGNFMGTRTKIIFPKDIADSDVFVDEIPDQDGAGTDPSVTIRFNGETLIPRVDYNLSYAYNVSTGIGTVTIKGIGNYTGTRKKIFLIGKDKRTEKLVTISLKPGHEPYNGPMESDQG